MVEGTPPVWIELVVDQLTAANVRAEAEARGLLLQAVMRLYYRHDRLRAMDLLFHWEVARDDLRALFGGSRFG
jgi:hypothetical protein